MNTNVQHVEAEPTPDEQLEAALALLERKVPGIVKLPIGPRTFLRLA